MPLGRPPGPRGTGCCSRPGPQLKSIMVAHPTDIARRRSSRAARLDRVRPARGRPQPTRAIAHAVGGPHWDRDDPGCHHGLPAPARPARPGVHDPAQPGAHGLDAHRPRGRLQAVRRPHGLLRRARPRRGRPDRHGRLRAQHRGLDQAPRRHAVHQRRGPQAPPDHRGGARRGRPHRAADPAHRPLRLPPADRGPLADQEPDHAVHPTRPERARHRAPDQGLRQLRASWPARPATTASRSWAPRATSSTSSWSPTPTSAPTAGAARTPTGCACRSRSCAARARRSGRTSSSSTACRCST